MHEFLVSTAAFVVLVGVMVIVHEFGHFAVAKLFRVRVEAFSFGFGPRLFGFKYGETDYKVCLLPLGGYVKMTGETPTRSADAGTRKPTDRKATRARATPAPSPPIPAGSASSLASLVQEPTSFLAFVLMIFYYGLINEVPAGSGPVHHSRVGHAWFGCRPGRFSARRRHHPFRKCRKPRLGKNLRACQAQCQSNCARYR